MNLLKLNLWRAGIFKQAKYLISTPQQSQKVLEVMETGTVGIEFMPLNTGFIRSESVKKAWAAIHALKFQIYHDGKPTEGESVLIISERSYLPLDPLETLKQKDREKLASLKDIAKVRHAQARAAAGQMDKNRDMAELVIQWSFLILALYGVIAFFRGC